MTRNQRRSRIYWIKLVTQAIGLGDSDAAYVLTVNFVRRLRSLGVL